MFGLSGTVLYAEPLTLKITAPTTAGGEYSNCSVTWGNGHCRGRIETLTAGRAIFNREIVVVPAYQVKINLRPAKWVTTTTIFGKPEDIGDAVDLKIQSTQGRYEVTLWGNNSYDSKICTGNPGVTLNCQGNLKSSAQKTALSSKTFITQYFEIRPLEAHIAGITFELTRP